MISIEVSQKYNQKKLDKFLMENFRKLSQSSIYKAIRTKNIRINGIKISANTILNTGDQLDIYIKDEILYGVSLKDHQISLDIIYEDQHLLLVNKKPGIQVLPDKDCKELTLIDVATQYLKEKDEYPPDNPVSFPPSLCHRLDRNTGGIIIIAKTQEALTVMLDKIKKREVKKYYQCIVIGCPNLREAELKHYLFKDQKKSHVYISDVRKSGWVEIITRYKVISRGKEMSKLEVELVTGKTHQIRAHLAHIGHPIVGDGKYGVNKFNRMVGSKHQALWAYKVEFDFKDGEILDYLRGKVFETYDIEFDIKGLDLK